MARWEVVWHGLIYIAEEMGVALRKTAVSPNIRDRLDFSCAVLDPDGVLVAQAEHIPVHLGSMAYAGTRVVEEAYRVYGGVGEGDVLATNDPYIAGTHLNDVMVVKPVYISGRLAAWLACKAHHVDVGGPRPGSMNPEASTMLEEGFTLPLVKLVEGGRVRRDPLRILEANTRTPRILAMDLHAQVAALSHGERLLRELAERHGLERLEESMREAVDYVERYTRSMLGEYEGSSSAVDYVEARSGAAEIRLRLSIGGGVAVLDYSGTSPQLPEPVNAVYGVTLAASTYALKSILDPGMPVNAGFYRAVEVRAPEGSLLNPRPPAPVAAGNTETSQRIVDVVYKALAGIPGLGDRVPAASGGTMTNVLLGGADWAFYETVGCGSGGRPGLDGVDGVHVNMTNTLNTPIEVLEEEHPVVIERYELRTGSGGLGEYRGGLGIVRAYRVLERVRLSVLMSRVLTAPWGLRGGEPGSPGRVVVVRRSGDVEEHPPSTTTVLEPGDILYIETPGGGGYGDPCRRERRLIERDVEDGKYPGTVLRLWERMCRGR